jgi:hypothetical protein
MFYALSKINLALNGVGLNDANDAVSRWQSIQRCGFNGDGDFHSGPFGIYAHHFGGASSSTYGLFIQHHMRVSAL